MKRLLGFVTVSALLVITIDPVLAQQPAPRPPGGAHEHGQQQAPAPGQQAPVPGQPTPSGGGPHGGGMGGMMSGGMMGGAGMGGMMGGMRGGRGGEGPMGLCPTAAMLAHHDVKTMARNLRLCGDLLKAMGDVLLKHRAELEKAGR